MSTAGSSAPAPPDLTGPRWYQRGLGQTALLLAWLVPLILLSMGQLLRGVPYSPDSDFMGLHLGLKWHLYRSLWTHHQLPLWSPYQFSGLPALSNPQALFTYPLDLLYWLLPPTAAAGPTLVLHYLVMAVGYHVLGGALRLGVPARLLMATAGLFNFKTLLAGYAGWMATVPILALLPWLLAASLWLTRRPTPGRALCLGLVGALVLHAGPPQLVYYLLLWLAPFAAVTTYQARGEAGRARALLLCYLGAGLLALGLCAYLLLPMVSDLGLFARQGVDYAFFQGQPIGLSQLLTFFYPEILGTPLDGSRPFLWGEVAYFGLVPLLLSLYAVASRGAPRHRWLVFGFVLSVVCALEGPSHLLYRILPGFRLFRLPGRFLFVAALFGVALAGVGFERLAAHLRGSGDGLGRRRIGAALGAALLLMSAEGTYYARRYLFTAPAEVVVPQAGYRALLQADAARDPAPYRLAIGGRVAMNLSWAAPFDLPQVGGFDSANLAHYQRYFKYMVLGDWGQLDASPWLQVIRLSRPDLLDALNVKYLLSTKELTATDLELIGQLPSEPTWAYGAGFQRTPVRVYRHRHPLSRAFFPPRAVVVPDEAAAQAEIARGNLREVAVVHGGPTRPDAAPGGAATTQVTGGAATAQVTDHADGRLRVEARTDSGRYLVLSEVWHPGWQAWLDGQPIPLLRADVALMAAWVPPGAHTLELRFRPTRLTLGLWISAAAAALALGVLLWYRFLPTP